MNKTQKNFVKGAAILGIVGLVCKVIGAIYRIPMTGMIGARGMAYYQTAYPIYAMLLAISSAGLPVAISKMVSERITLSDYKGAHVVFQTAFKALALIGLLTTAAMLLLSGAFANASGRPDADIVLMAIAPALFFVSLLSAYRGYFQGLQIMSPTAFSQLIEQLGKLGLGLVFAYMWKDYGIAYGAAGAVLGITLSEVLALLFMLVLYNGRKREIKLQIGRSGRKPVEKEGIGKRLFILAFPIVLGALAMPSVMAVDNAIVTNSLTGMGYGKDLVDSLYGSLTSVVNPLINMPAVLSLALAMSLVPAISASIAQKDESGAAKKSGMGFKLAMLVGLPSAVGFYLLSMPIIKLLYTRLTLQEYQVSEVLLEIMAIGVLFLTIVQTMTGILQGLGKTYLPVINLFIGVAVKITVSLVFIQMPEINIKGAAIGTVACYTVAAVLDIFCVVKYAKFKFSLTDYIIKPVLAAVFMGAFVYFLYPVLSHAINEKLATAVVILIAIIIYGICIFLFGVLKKEDMEFMPGGRLIARLMVKLNVWKERA